MVRTANPDRQRRSSLSALSPAILRSGAAAAFGALLLGLSACGGTVGSGGAGDSDDSGAGLPAGASAEEYQEALADLDPITITYQAGSASAEGLAALRDVKFIDAVEEASGGKVVLEPVWGQAIAPYTEVHSALVDGRLDLAVMLPMYSPGEYPVNDAFVAATTLGGNSPLVDELAVNAAFLEVGWNSEELIGDYEGLGLTTLMPLQASSSILSVCNVAGGELEDWRGRQVRVPSTTAEAQSKALGAAPVSLEHSETYEALQRGTVDCTFTGALVASEAGFASVAPHVVYPEDVNFARGPNAILAGPGFNELPLVVRQLVFDQAVQFFEGGRIADLESKADFMAAVAEVGGEVEPIGDSAEAALAQSSEDLVQEHIDDGTLPADVLTTIPDAITRWQGVVEELGYADGGELRDMNEWYDLEEADFQEYTARVYDEIFSQHRPS